MIQKSALSIHGTRHALWHARTMKQHTAQRNAVHDPRTHTALRMLHAERAAAGSRLSHRSSRRSHCTATHTHSTGQPSATLHGYAHTLHQSCPRSHCIQTAPALGHTAYTLHQPSVTLHGYTHCTAPRRINCQVGASLLTQEKSQS